MTSVAKHPHVIFVVLDTLCADRLSCYGYQHPTSPNLDRLARSGWLFENAIASSCWTLPSQSSLFTGLHPFEHGANDENLYLSDEIPTLAELFRQIGYETIAYALDNMWLSQATNLSRGFNRFFDANYKFPPPAGSPILRKINHKIRPLLKIRDQHRSTLVIKKVIERLSQWSPPEAPLFIYMNLMDTHMPYHPAHRFCKKFGLKNADPDDVQHLQKNFKQIRTRPDALTNRQLSTLNGLYDACVASADRRLARLWKFLDRQKYQNNTIIVATSDHGEHLGEHNLLNHWFSLHDILLKVPLIITFPPKLTPSRRITPQVQQHHLFHTLLDLIDYQGPLIPPEQIKANSFLEYVKGRIPFPEYTYAEHAYPATNLFYFKKQNPDFNDKNLFCAKQAVRTNQFKYIRYGSGREELFHLETDPGETKNVRADYPQIAETLKQKLDQKRARVKTRPPDAVNIRDFDPVVKKRLADLGYI